MKRPILSILIVLMCGTAYAQLQQRQQLPGRYFTPDTLMAQLNNASNERSAQFYLMGAYDLTQDANQSCAVRGTTTPTQLEQVFSDYLQNHPELKNSDRTAAGIAAQAFIEHWPCQK
jgi:Rap1a immunity proteins